MYATRKTARIVGGMFLISNITFILGAVLFLEPVISAAEYLTLVSANRASVVSGVILELINGFAYLVIGVSVYPIFRPRFPGMAIGYVALRIIEFVMQTLSDLSPLALITLSEDFVTAGAANISTYQTTGALLLADRYWAFQMVSITLGLGALLLYSMLFQTKLVPRFLSVWGFLAAIIVLANTALDIYGIPPGNLGILMLLNEVFLGIWLIVKGFNPPVTVSENEN